ncbi:MAG: hypothetical protein CBD74_14555 [Saprospirales bacterium TMED214]|nr:MAG: hypothetical protein CBD74_14555 [Saprospirales bacterium TMED214]
MFYYLQAFWSVVVLNCAQPVNWEYCLPVHQWLFPAIQEAWVIKMNPQTIYQNERDILNSLK